MKIVQHQAFKLNCYILAEYWTETCVSLYQLSVEKAPSQQQLRPKTEHASFFWFLYKKKNKKKKQQQKTDIILAK